jgi:hypothetical protein
MHPMELLGEVGLVEPRFGLSGDRLVLVHDMFTVCAVHTTGSKNRFGCTRWNC